MLREPVAIASWLTLGGIAMVLPSLGSPARRAAPTVTALLFLASAAATRYWLRETRSRWQLVAFVLAATLVALGQRRRLGSGTVLIGWFISIGCAAVGVVMVRWATEGSPF